MYIDNLGSSIRYERKSWGMSLNRLARLSNIDKEDIIEIESGKNKNPDFFVMLKICEVLQISVFESLKDKHIKF